MRDNIVLRDLSVNELQRQLGEGQPAAFEAIYHRYHLLLLSDVRRLMPSFDAQMIDDVVQNVFVRLWEHRLRLSKAANLKTVLQKMARDYAIDTLRDCQCRRGAPLDERLPSGCRQPITQLQRRELVCQIENACSVLSDAQRTALELKLTGLSAKQIAELLGCTAKAVERRAQVARQRLRNGLLADDCEVIGLR